MSQNDYTIGNQSAPDFRSDLNDALQALASLSSGSTAPSTTYANMLWYDTANNILKMRTEADDAWINIGTLDQSTNEFEVAGLTTLSEATWETGTSTTESLVSPAKVKAAIDSFAPTIGVGQTWQDVSASRANETAYQNTTGKPIQVAVRIKVDSPKDFEVSSDGSTWVTVPGFSSVGDSNVWAIIPDGWYYIARGSGTIGVWAELR